MDSGQFLFLLPLLLTSLAFPAIAHASGYPILGVLSVGRRPEGIAVDTRTHLVYIADESPGVVVAFDPISNKVRWRTRVGDAATDVQVDSGSHQVYATGFARDTGELTILDGTTGKIELAIPVNGGDNALAIDSQRHRAYVSNDQNGVVDVITLMVIDSSGRLHLDISTLRTGGKPEALGVNSRLGRLYVGDFNNHTVTVFDEDSMRKVTSVQVADGPVQPLRVDEATGRVYVVCSLGEELDVIDGNTNAVMARVPVGPYPEGVAYNTATGRIYVADEGDKEGSNQQQPISVNITVIDGQTFEVLGTLAVGRSPDGVEADPALHRLYVAVEDGDAMVEVSDSGDIPLHTNGTFHQSVAARNAISYLQQATIITLIVMIVTIVGAALSVRLRHWRAQGSPQTPPGSASSRSEKHTLPL